MKTAEKLRQELINNAPFTKEEFINEISRRIKHGGTASFVCDYHISKTELKGGLGTIRMNHEQAAIEYARSEGFNVSYKHNSYGVRFIVFSL